MCLAVQQAEVPRHKQMRSNSRPTRAVRASYHENALHRGFRFRGIVDFNGDFLSHRDTLQSNCWGLRARLTSSNACFGWVQCLCYTMDCTIKHALELTRPGQTCIFFHPLTLIHDFVCQFSGIILFQSLASSHLIRIILRVELWHVRIYTRSAS